jgi:hypothetical protein
VATAVVAVVVLGALGAGPAAADLTDPVTPLGDVATGVVTDVVDGTEQATDVVRETTITRTVAPKVRKVVEAIAPAPAPAPVPAARPTSSTTADESGSATPAATANRNPQPASSPRGTVGSTRTVAGDGQRPLVGPVKTVPGKRVPTARPERVAPLVTVPADRIAAGFAAPSTSGFQSVLAARAAPRSEPPPGCRSPSLDLASLRRCAHATLIPDTGGPWFGLLAWGVLACGVGALLVGADRRRVSPARAR